MTFDVLNILLICVEHYSATALSTPVKNSKIANKDSVYFLPTFTVTCVISYFVLDLCCLLKTSSLFGLVATLKNVN